MTVGFALENISGKGRQSNEWSILGFGRKSVRLMVCSLEYAIVEDVSAPLCGGVPSECGCSAMLVGWLVGR